MRRRIALFLLLALFLLVPTAAGEGIGVGVYYIGPSDGVYATLARSAPYLTFVDRAELADVFVVNDAELTAAEMQAIGQWVREERAGLVVFASPTFPRSVGDLRATLGVGAVELSIVDDGQPRKVHPGTEPDPLMQAMAWASAPPVANRTVVANVNVFRPLLLTEEGEPVVERMRGRDRYQVFVVSPWLADPSNADWLVWPYLNYLIYRLTAEGGGERHPLPFADYPLAPVPHAALRFWLTVGGLVIFIGSVALYSVVRRRAFLRAANSPPPPPAGRWARVGFHRPLAGALLMAAGGIVLFTPLWFYADWFIPRRVFPLGQTAQLWQQVTIAVGVVAVLLDGGVGTASVWYFTRLYPYRPDEALHYFQFFLWWQWLTGAFLFGLMAVVAGLFLPFSLLAHLTYPLLFLTALQFPGFLTLFRLLFRAMQRFDAEQVLMVAALAGLPVFQGTSAYLLRRWGATEASIGAEVGAMGGMALGAAFDLVFVFLLGLVLAYSIGFRPRSLLLPTFDRRVGERVLGYGVRLVAGDLVMPLLALGVMLWLPHWPLLEAQRQALSPLFAMAAAALLMREGLFGDLMPAVAEVAVAGYRTLLRYYLSRGLRYGLRVGFFLAAAGGAVAGALLRGVVKMEFPAAALFPLWGALAMVLWWADAALEGVGRPMLRSWLRLPEGGAVAVLLVLLVPRYGLRGFAWALVVPAFVRAVAALLVVRRVVIAPHLYLWQAVIAPGGAALVIYHLLRAVVLFVEPTHIRDALLVALLGWLSLPLYAFLTALLGGWEPQAVEELESALALIGPLRLPFLPLVMVVRLGARLSPLKGHYPAHWWSLADEEATALTLHRPGWHERLGERETASVERLSGP